MEAALVRFLIFLAFLGVAYFGAKGAAILLAWKDVIKQDTDDATNFLNEVYIWASIFLFILAFILYPYIQ